jgi:DNA-binding GntR family transcriptional regulator
VRQALFQLSQKRLVTLEPARGAFVASPSADEARQVFAVRRMLELEMTRAFVRAATPANIRRPARACGARKGGGGRGDVASRTELLGDFHVRMAELLGNEVLAQMLRDLLALRAHHADVPERQRPPRTRRPSTCAGGLLRARDEERRPSS